MEFRILSADEEKDFRNWAIENIPKEDESYPLYHPVIKDEWIRMGYKFKL